MTRDKMLELWETRENGNISEFNAAIKKMKKLEMLEMIEHVQSHFGIPRFKVILYLRDALER